MKLYATTTSERASKSQGGNSLHIQVLGEQREILINFRITMQGNIAIIKGKYFTYPLDVAVGKPIGLALSTKTKGEKQKGEVCTYCDNPATKERDGLELVCDKH